MNQFPGCSSQIIYFKNSRKSCSLIGSLALLVAAQVHAETSNRGALADMSLEELASLEVTSVTKSAKPVSEAVASIFVITNEDIHDAGSPSLPEALRLAPNLQVAQVDARNYAITARGFNNPFENKLLVMIDGRTLYSPLFSGVYWDAQDVVLEDLERIEVVSGAGGTMWGANAVNGVVNIVTRSSEKTQGELISVGASAHEQYASARYGGHLGAGDGHYRVYVKRAQHDDTETEDGISTETGYGRTQAGFRMDWGKGAEAFTLQGDAYTGNLRQIGTKDIEISGANILARKGWQLAESKLSVQAYLDHTQRDQPNAFAQKMNTWDIELQHEIPVGDAHNVVWGAGYRYITDRIDNNQNFAFLPGDINRSWKNIFIQDEITLASNLKLTLGSKWEDNPYTGVESMPAVKMGWQPDSTNLVWAGASRAVRSPSRIDHDFYAPTNPPVVNGVAQYAVGGGPDFISEVADVFEIGYRSQPVAHVSWSITAYYSEYDRLRTLELNAPGPGVVFKNMAEAETYGVEMWGSWQPHANWRLHGGLAAQKLDVRVKPGSLDLSNATVLANGDPDYFWMLRSTNAITDKIEVNTTLRYVAEVEGFKLPSYTALDVHVSWTLMPKLELSVVGQNLLDSRHAEFAAAPGRSEIERAVFAKFVWGL